MLTQEDIKDVNNVFQSFIKEKYEWEVHCNLLDKDKSLSNDEKLEKQKKSISDIFNKYCTQKERKEGLPNIISYNIVTVEEEFIEEKITDIEEVTSNKVILSTERKDSLNSKYQYIFERKRGVWLIDSKKRYSNWKQKWIIESL
jgi:predicted CopG family antitoxin